MNIKFYTCVIFLIAICSPIFSQESTALFKAEINELSGTLQIPKWVKIDDFESSEAMKHWTLADTKNNTNPRIENPQVTEVRRDDSGQNHYLLKKPASDGIVGNRKALSYRRLPVAVEVGEIYTFYTRINIEYFPNNHAFGLSNLQPDEINLHDYNAFEPFFRVTEKRESDGTKNDGTLMICKGKGKKYAKIFNFHTNSVAKAMHPNIWYEIWYVVNNNLTSKGGQSYDVYFKGGDEFPKQQRVFVKADFRIGRALPLIYFLTNCNTGPVDAPYGNGGLRFDDLYMIPGVVLSTPFK